MARKPQNQLWRPVPAGGYVVCPSLLAVYISCQPKVAELDFVSSDENVFRLQVSMHIAVLVDVVKPGQDARGYMLDLGLS
mmetsp:Transcript_23656/g.93370  ORF Transcript_23656/g.93370 Transcript_23656/m.93370 type:complete len:80 (+) Transcript_23656:1108-1347(+)